MINISAMQTNNPVLILAAFAANGLAWLATKATATIAFPTARYLSSRAHLLNLFALLLLVAVAVPVVFAAASVLVPLLTALLVAALPVLGKIAVGGLLIAAFAKVTRPA